MNETAKPDTIVMLAQDGREKVADDRLEWSVEHAGA